MTDNEKIIRANYNLVGPLFYRFLFKLHMTHAAYDPEDTVVLFLSRGGIRMRYFYELFLQRNGLKSAIPYSDFYVSRMAVIKANMIANYELVYQDFLNEYYGYTIGDAVHTFFGNDVYVRWDKMHAPQDKGTLLNQDTLNLLLWGDTESADYLRRVLYEQNELYLKYLREIAGEKKNIVIVDTGWSGSILTYMDNLDPEREYTALYFGRYNYGKDEPGWFNKIVGVEAEDRDFNLNKPETALFLNRHLIEGLSEIRWPSVDGYQMGADDSVEPLIGFAPQEMVIPLVDEAQAYGVMKYIFDAGDRLDIHKIHESGDRAARLLCRRLMYPGRDDLAFFSVATRSADFGKELDVPMFLPPIRNIFNFKKKLNNIKISLWPSGQVTVEFPLTHCVLQYIYHRRKRFRGILQKLGIV